jgi:DNA-binding SARP family transcriptional activator
MDDLESVRQLAAGLLQQGERCARAGLLQQAEALMVQAWSMAEGCAPDLANSAAWEAAMLLVHTQNYDGAAEWLGRVAAPPTGGSGLWPAGRQALMHLCRSRATTPSVVAASSVRVLELQPFARRGRPLPARPLLNVINLGHFTVVRGGTVLPHCPARKAISIFRYLLTRRHHRAHKEALMDLFWPDAHPRYAVHSLHVAVSALRRYLDPPGCSYLLLENGHYAIDPDAPVEDDCLSFELLCNDAEKYWRSHDLPRAQQAYTRALTCYQGDYDVDGQDLTWAAVERERLLVRYMTALDHLGQILIVQGLLEQAIECYQRLLERDSYREDAHGQLMRCYMQLGRRGAAVQQYERCAALLAAELSLEPMPEIQDLYRLIVSTGERDVYGHAAKLRLTAAPEPIERRMRGA